MWPLFHYVLPMSPESSGRFDQEMWQAYVKANKVRRGAEGGTLFQTQLMGGVLHA